MQMIICKAKKKKNTTVTLVAANVIIVNLYLNLLKISIQG